MNLKLMSLYLESVRPTPIIKIAKDYSFPIYTFMCVSFTLLMSKYGVEFLVEYLRGIKLD